MPGPHVFLGFNVADSMFAGKADCLIFRRNISTLQFLDYLERGIVSCLNPSHSNTISEIERRFNASLPVPDKPPRITLQKGDTVLVISSRGLPRKTGNVVEYTPEELKKASFSFSTYTLVDYN